jgi:glutamate-ammonia-ligase adenylyltransferase
MPEQRDDLEAFIESLPDRALARVFLDRFESLHPRHAAQLKRKPALLARALTLASYSPFLGETLLRHPEHIEWLEREGEQGLSRVKSTEQLSEDLARLVTRLMDADTSRRLARFKRREMLRIYLRDCLHLATLAEVTEELSNLADVVLGYALALSEQETTNAHGAPLTRDERGRITQAEFAIVSLGKLGCRELNYASDVDLLFLYSGPGETAGHGSAREQVITNKEYFTKVANRVVQLIGSNLGEGVVYRIDLRLRPYGRDGDTVWEVEQAADYYRTRSENWERQALIRARASAGSEALVARFLDSVREVVFDPGALPHSLSSVRRAKEKIDRHVASQTGGFNVKLGRGGIREIEFIAQALQLAHGGREPWVRSAQTLIVLARLAEKGYLSESERTRLSAAYTFLRTVEHRLQMEHGAQTHQLPIARDRLDLVARRSGYVNAADPAGALIADLQRHTSAVRAIYNRVFEEKQTRADQVESPAAQPPAQILDEETDRMLGRAADAIDRLVTTGSTHPSKASVLSGLIASSLAGSINPLRSLRNLAQWAESFATYDDERQKAAASFLAPEHLPESLRRLVATLSSQYLSQILVSRPALAEVVAADRPLLKAGDYMRLMREAVERATGSTSKADALRRAWYRLVIDIGYRDMTGAVRETGASPDERLRANNLEQTALAEAALNLAVEITLSSLGVECARARDLPFAVLGLGRLGHTGMDYGSDIDLLVIFDSSAPWPPAGIELAQDAGWGSPPEFYARFVAEMVRVLSSITREGFLYRIDLRLRPDGQSGPLSQAIASLLGYLRDRASAWEHSAYLKVREVAGDLAIGARARRGICDAVFDAASRNPSLKDELSSMRERLEKEKGRAGRPDIKWGPGGMTDVYFITRYLQLRDRVYFPPERGTVALIRHLGERGSLGSDSAKALFEGYTFLRHLDHWMRLLLDRPTPLLPASDIALRDIASALRLSGADEVERLYAHHSAAIRSVYDQVLKD